MVDFGEVGVLRGQLDEDVRVAESGDEELARDSGGKEGDLLFKEGAFARGLRLFVDLVLQKRSIGSH